LGLGKLHASSALDNNEITREMAAPAHDVFALTPALKPDHAKIYESGIKAVCDEAFDCEADGLYQFLEQDIQDKVDKMGWTDGILSITQNIGDPEAEREEDFIANY
jgi:hypothetical protein